MHFELLPMEVLSHILSFVVAAEELENDRNKPSLKNYACVSRCCQMVVEPHTFKHIKLESVDFNRFQEIFAGKRRQQSLRYLDYAVILPEYSKNRTHKFETKKENAKNGIVFHRAVVQLFELLKTWNRSGTSNRKASIMSNGQQQQHLRVYISTHSPTDPPFQQPGPGLGIQRMADSIIDFPEDVEALPTVQAITEFTHGSVRAVHLNAVSKMLTTMPRLNEVRLVFTEPQLKRDLVFRRDYWRALGHLFDTLAQCSYLKQLHCSHTFWEPGNHSFDPGDMRQPGTIDDQTIVALHKLALSSSSSLQQLVMRGWFPMSPQLFWPYDNDSSHVQTRKNLLSSNLEYLYIQCNIRSPEGEWYYRGHPDAVASIHQDLVVIDDNNNNNDAPVSDSDDSFNSEVPDIPNERRENILNGNNPYHQWRNQIDEETFNPLLTALVRATLHLPHLQRMYFAIGVDLRQSRRIVIQCADAGYEMSEAWLDETGWESESEMEDDESHIETETEIATRRYRIWIGTDLTWELPAEIEALMKEWAGEKGLVRKDTWPKWSPHGSEEGDYPQVRYLDYDEL